MIYCHQNSTFRSSKWAATASAHYLPGRICQQKMACDLMPHPVATNFNIASSGFCLGRAKKQHDSNSRLVSDDYDTIHQGRWLAASRTRTSAESITMSNIVLGKKQLRVPLENLPAAAANPLSCSVVSYTAPWQTNRFNANRASTPFESVANSPSNTVRFNPC